MKTSIKILLLLIFIFSINAKAQTFEWAKSIGGDSDDSGTSIALDASGNVYTIGYFQGIVDFDPNSAVHNLSAAGYGSNSLHRPKDIFIQKMDALGNLIWAKNMGEFNKDDEGLSITLDASGNIYASGYFNASADFGNYTLASNGYKDAFITKLNNSGTVLWAKSLGSTNYSDYGFSVSVDNSGNVYTTGTYRGTADLNSSNGTDNHTSIGNNDLFIQKLNSNGSFIWAKSVGGFYSDEGKAVVLDAAGNIYIAGNFNNTVDFDPSVGATSLTAYGESDAFILKLDNTGSFVWVRQIGGVEHDYAHTISIDNSGGLYIGGEFRVTADLNPTASGVLNFTSNGGSDMFLIKMTTIGDFVWAKSTGGTVDDAVKSLALDAFGNIYTTGYFRGTTDFDPSVAGTFQISAGSRKMPFVQKLDMNGDFIWAQNFGKTSYNDQGNGISVATDGSVYLTGEFEGNTTDFDPTSGVYNLASNGHNDIFIVKLGQVLPCSETTSTLNESICQGDSYNFGNQTITMAGSYKDTLVNAGGCDSVITLNLIINALPNVEAGANQTITAGASVSLLGTGAVSYSWNNGVQDGVAFIPTTTMDYMLTGTDANGCVNTDIVTITVNAVLTSPCSELFISEYIEGSGYNKAIEIYNPTSATINLSNYSIETYTNGSSTSSNSVSLSGMLVSGATYFVAHTSSDMTLQNVANQLHSFPFNGNDAITLVNGSATIDIIGKIGQSMYWSSNGVSTKDKTMVRKNTIQAGVNTSPSVFDPSIEWDVLPKDDFSNVGIHSSSCITVVSCSEDVMPITASTCDGTNYTFGNQTLTIGGTYYDTLQNIGGCDSILVLTLTVHNLPVVVASASVSSVCSGNSLTLTGQGANTYTWDNGVMNGTSFIPSTTINYVVTGTDLNNCSSVDNITITVNSPSTSTISETICSNGTYTFGTQSLSTSGTYTETFTNESGCDSIVTLTLSVSSPITSTISETICSNETYTFGTQSLNTSGTYTETFTNGSGCDSVVTLNLVVNMVSNTTIQDSICDGETYVFNTQNLTTSGAYSQIYTNSIGCDSIVTLELYVKTVQTPVITSNGGVLIVTAGADYQWSINGTIIVGEINQTYTATENGIYSVDVTFANECSSSANYSVQDVSVSSLNQVALNIFPNPNNGTFTLETSAGVIFSLYNLLGEEIRNNKEYITKQKIDLSSQENGVFLLKVVSRSGEIVTKRIVKQ